VYRERTQRRRHRDFPLFNGAAVGKSRDLAKTVSASNLLGFLLSIFLEAASTAAESRQDENQGKRRKTMEIREIMTPNPVCCTPDTALEAVARLMVRHDCGEIPVVESEDTMRLAGVITDRDIVCRTLAQGKDPLKMTAGECMSAPAVTVTPETRLEDCCQVMEEHRIRRVPVVDQNECCCGMVSQADIARRAPTEQTAEVVKEVSQSAAAMA
jgi:CBS domain-containing protein